MAESLSNNARFKRARGLSWLLANIFERLPKAELAGSAGDNPEINRLLGTEGTLGEMLGLSADWAKNAIMAGGNYGEIFEKNIGENTPIGLSRGLNAQWTDGGLLYVPPFR